MSAKPFVARFGGRCPGCPDSIIADLDEVVMVNGLEWHADCAPVDDANPSDDSGVREIHETTRLIAREVIEGRLAAHAKHGDESVESKPGDAVAFWLACLGEEFGEVCEALTYDKDSGKLRAELVDVITVATAWVAALDRLEGRG